MATYTFMTIIVEAIVMAYSLIFKAGNTITFGVVDILPVNTSSY